MQLELRIIEEAWNNRAETTEDDKVHNLAAFWVEWIKDLMVFVADRQKDWMAQNIAKAKDSYGSYESGFWPTRRPLLQRLDDYLEHSRAFSIDTSDWQIPGVSEGVS